jgi:hypothetical protein
MVKTSRIELDDKRHWRVVFLFQQKAKTVLEEKLKELELGLRTCSGLLIDF